MLRKGLVVSIISLALIISGLGCLKMQSKVMVHPNGSVSGTATLGIDETYFNMSGDANLTFGNMSLVDTENATMWKEDGWVYFQEDESFLDEENMSVQVKKFPEYTEYIIDANLSEFQEEAEEEDEFNLTDPFTQVFLQQMVFTFDVAMPGEIVEANTLEIDGSTARWSYNGVTIQEADKLYVRSRLPMPEGIISVPLLGLIGILWKSRVK